MTSVEDQTVNPRRPFLPVHAPLLGAQEIRYVTEALTNSEISGTYGKFLDRFEREFADYCNCSHGVATSSGTTALHLALASLGIGPGDEVLVSTLTNMATFFAVLYQGATPVPVDVEEDTWNLNPALLESLVTSRTKAILVVHLYGHPADMDPILDFARRHRLNVIEDVAEAHGALYKGRKVGSFGNIGCFSFYANKIITTGEGGMITTNDLALAERARSLRSLAFGRENKFMHAAIGFNYRMTNLQAALGCAQLERIDAVIENKRRVARLYTEQLSDLPEVQLPAEKPYARNVYWMYHVVLRKLSRADRDAVMQRLSQRGIEIRPAFIPYNLQEVFIQKGMTRPELCPVANRIADSGFYLPSSSNLNEEEIIYVSRQLREVLNEVKHSSFQLPAQAKRKVSSANR
ncbi:MAG TPA: DegT/DnrJ/EryC1/StrS family aminotransferase [Candidatus Acidoferrales bacterium]|nr:DegT/DnrJ/EryC1/StrS family aminotransferase [Candidatus Acidoferrales bacterium]